jgi:hypothetical protein
MTAIDAQELLLLVGQHAKQNDDSATQLLARTSHQLSQAQKAYTADEAAVSGAENGLINAQQTLKIVVLAATTPGAAATGGLPSLQLDEATHPATTTTTGVAPTTASPDGAASAAIQAPIENINGTPAVSPDILSGPELNAQQLQAWWATLNRQANVTVPINDLIQSYENWGKKLKVRYDIAFAQSIIETGYFSFPAFGQLTAKDNNFAGIGACDTCAHGWSFPTADTGVQAQLELLYEYSTNKPFPDPHMKNVIGATGVGGCCQTWTQLAGKWASSTVYGISIMTVYNQMLQWLIPQAELSNGLITPNQVAARGPELAPLPGSPPATAGKTGPGQPSTTSTTAPAGGGGVSAASTKKP